MASRPYQICTNCVMDTTDSLITFDEDGICDHCNNYYKNILPNWHPNEIGAKKLKRVLKQIKTYGQGKEYDCIIGLSGGLDSSYLAYKAIAEWGLRPLLLYVDTGWNLDIAERNIYRIVNQLDYKLETITVNWDEMRDLQLAFFKSQVASQDVQDHAIFAALYNTAAKNKVKYVLTGSNISTECIREPVEWAYVNDLRNIRDIHRRFGTIPLKEFPTCSMFKYKLYYRYVKGMHVIKPLDLIPYQKNRVISELEDRFGFESYENKHYESLFTRYFEGYWLIKKFGYDKRRAHYSSLIVTGQMDRETALNVLSQPPYNEELARRDQTLIAEKLGISTMEFIALMEGPNRSNIDYQNNAMMVKLAIGLAKLVGLEKRNFR